MLVDAGDGDRARRASCRHPGGDAGHDRGQRRRLLETPRRPAPASSTTRPSATAAASASAAARASAGSCSPTTTTTGAVTAPTRAGAVPRGERLEVADRGPRVGLHPLAERPLVDRRAACRGRSRSCRTGGGPGPAVTWRTCSIVGRVGRRRRRRPAAHDDGGRPVGPRRGGLEGDRGAHAVAEQHRRRQLRGGRRAPSAWAAMASIAPRLSSPPERPWAGRSKAIGRCRRPGHRARRRTRCRCRRRRGRTAPSAPSAAAGGWPGSVVGPRWWTNVATDPTVKYFAATGRNVPKRRAPRPTVVGSDQASTSS